MTMIERMQELERRVGAVENERARNITALVERLHALEKCTDWQPRGFRERLEALERSLPHPIEVVTPLAFPLNEPPLASMQVGPGAVAPQNQTQHAPSPDYAIPDYVMAEPEEPCSCDEAMALRAECARLRAAVPFPDDPDRVATLARKLASETEGYQRALKTEYAKREAVESELSAALQAIDLLRSLDNVQRAVAYLDRAERAERRVAEQRERIKQDCVAAELRAAELREAEAMYSRQVELTSEVRSRLAVVIEERDTALSRATKAEREVARLERAHRVTPGY